jgi:hypothetical protein
MESCRNGYRSGLLNHPSRQRGVCVRIAVVPPYPLVAESAYADGSNPSSMVVRIHPRGLSQNGATGRRNRLKPCTTESSNLSFETSQFRVFLSELGPGPKSDKISPIWV